MWHSAGATSCDVAMLKLVGRCYMKVPNEVCNCCLITGSVVSFRSWCLMRTSGIYEMEREHTEWSEGKCPRIFWPGSTLPPKWNPRNCIFFCVHVLVINHISATRFCFVWGLFNHVFWRSSSEHGGIAIKMWMVVRVQTAVMGLKAAGLQTVVDYNSDLMCHLTNTRGLQKKKILWKKMHFYIYMCVCIDIYINKMHPFLYQKFKCPLGKSSYGRGMAELCLLEWRGLGNWSFNWCTDYLRQIHLLKIFSNSLCVQW